MPAVRKRGRQADHKSVRKDTGKDSNVSDAVCRFSDLAGYRRAARLGLLRDTENWTLGTYDSH